MVLEGSCRCGAVRFSVESDTPYPYMRCYCSICRKVGGSGYAINIMGRAATLTIEGADNTGIYHAEIEGRPTDGGRHFCTRCGTMLWNFDPRWPDLGHPFASAIDTPLPEPPEIVHIMLDFKAGWVPMRNGPTDRHFAGYPDETIEEWHRRHGLYGATR